MNPNTKWNGSDLVQLSRQELFDPTQGWTYAEEWVGTEEQIDTLIAGLDGTVRSTRSVKDDQHYVSLQTATPEAGVTEVPVDTYELATEYETVDVWGNPKIQKGTGLDQVVRMNDHLDCLGKFRRFCETRLRDLYNGYVQFGSEVSGTTPERQGKGPTPHTKLGLLLADGTVNPLARSDFQYGESDTKADARVTSLNHFYWMMLMGTERWDYRRIVFSRRRTCSVKYAARHIADGVEKIYTRAALIRDFAIPSDVATRLPVDPPNSAPRTVWAWKIRRQDSQQVPRAGRVEEMIDWIFAAWSVELFDLIT